MPTFSAHDGTQLAYHLRGDGGPLVCLPGGPMQDSAYLGDLGGLADRVGLVLLDHRGTGRSETPADKTSYRCDHLVDDVETLRIELGLERMDLLAHSAGANLALLYAARHPERVARLLLITPSIFAVGLTITGEDRREMVQRRADEPWFEMAAAAFEAVASGQAASDDWAAIAPFWYGRWDDAARSHDATAEEQRNAEAASVFGSKGAYDPDTTRAALASVQAPVLLLSGEVDIAAPPRVMAELAGLFPNVTFTIQPGAAHFPWLDDPARFTETLTSFLQQTT